MDGIRIRVGTVTVCVEMGWLLVQRNVREVGWDVMGMSVNVELDGQVWGMCHVWECVGMGYWCRVRSVREVGQGVGMDADVELDGIPIIRRTVSPNVGMVLFLVRKNVR